MFQINLNPNKYDLIKHGSKRIEMTVQTDKIKELKKGDGIRFICRYRIPIQYIDGVITEIDKYKTFEELVENYEPKDMESAIYKKERILSDLNSEYSEEEQKQNGVVAISFKIEDKK